MQEPAHLRTADAIRRKGKSAYSNGSRCYIEPVDMRSSIARRHRDLLALFSQEVGRDDPSTKLLVNCAASLTLLLEQHDAKIADGEASERTLSEYAKAAGSLFRILRSLGLARLNGTGGNVSSRPATVDELWRRHQQRGSQ